MVFLTKTKPPRRAATIKQQKTLILVYVTNVTTSEHTKHLKGIFKVSQEKTKSDVILKET